MNADTKSNSKNNQSYQDSATLNLKHDNTEVVPNTGIVSIQNRQYAIGLHWELTTALAKAEQEAKTRASESHFCADFFCVRRGTTPQFALGFKTSGHCTKLPALAALLADHIGGNWLGVFAVNDGFYVLAVTEGGILAETDRYFYDQLEVANFIKNLIDLVEWDQIYAPPQLNISSSKEYNLKELTFMPPTVRLKSTKAVMKFVPMILILLGVTFVLGWSYWYFNGSLDIKFFNPNQEVIEPNLIEQSELQSTSIQIPPLPWIGKSQGVPVLINCVTGISKFPPTLPGWSITELICNSNHASARLTRIGTLGESGGSINWIEPALQESNLEPELVLPEAGSSNLIEVNWAIQAVSKIETNQITATNNEVRTLLLKVFEERMTPITFSPSDSSEYWEGMTIQFSTRFDPLDFIDVLSLIPRFLISTVHYDPTLGEWTITGVIYEKSLHTMSNTY